MTAFQRKIANLWFSLSFSVVASKSHFLLITTAIRISNQFQREFLVNDAIASQEFSSASKHPLQKTNLLKRKYKIPFHCEAGRPAVTSRGQEGRLRDGGCCHLALSASWRFIVFPEIYKRFNRRYRGDCQSVGKQKGRRFLPCPTIYEPALASFAAASSAFFSFA
jgi:hypothetical protein